MGMAHRGRLERDCGIPAQAATRLMFAEFSENYMPNTTAGDGDVKYHLGYMTTRKLKSGEDEGRVAAFRKPRPSRSP